MFRFKDKLILMASLGAVLGVAHAVYATDVEFALESETETDQPATLHSGAELEVYYGEHVTLNFKTPLAVSGVPGEVPVTSPLFKACNFAETITDTKVTYTRGEGTSAIATMAFGKHTYSITGIRGSWAIALEKGRPMITWQFKGLFNAPTATGQAMLQPNWTNWKKPEVLGPENGSLFKLNNVDLKLHKLSVDVGNTVVYDRVITHAAIEIPAHKSKANVTVTATELQTFNPFELQGDVVNLQFGHGTAAGKKFSIQGRMQMPVPKYTNLSTELTGWELEGNLIPLNGNDELTVSFE